MSTDRKEGGENSKTTKKIFSRKQETWLKELVKVRKEKCLRKKLMIYEVYRMMTQL